MIERGDIYWYDFGPQSDSRQEGRRPVLIVQTNHLHRARNYALTIIVPLSTKGKGSPSHVRIEPSDLNGLRSESFVKTEQIFTVPVELLSSRIGVLSPADLSRVDQALKDSLALR